MHRTFCAFTASHRVALPKPEEAERAHRATSPTSIMMAPLRVPESMHFWPGAALSQVFCPARSRPFKAK